jgi:hypothetical protein
MSVKRVINIFNKTTEELIREVHIDFISLENLKEIFKAKPDDPFLYDSYPIEQDEKRRLTKYLSGNLLFDFSKFIYQLDCYKEE